MSVAALRACSDNGRPASPQGGPYEPTGYLTTPTPDGSGKATHPDVIDFGTAWNGYRYWMTFTPFADNNVSLENPCVLASSDGLTWSVPSGGSNPIVAAPASAPTRYNSDVDMVYANDGRLHLFFREGGVGGDHIYWMRSSNGTTWSTPLLLFQTVADACFSPAIVFDGVQYRMYYVASGVGVRMRTAPAPNGPWSTTARTIPLLGLAQPSHHAWHIDVIRARGRFVMTLNEPAELSSGKRIRIATSRDGLVFRTSRVLIDPANSALIGSQAYRGTCVRSGDTYRIWYGGLGSEGWRIFYSEIPVAEMP